MAKSKRKSILFPPSSSSSPVKLDPISELSQEDGGNSMLMDQSIGAILFNNNRVTKEKKFLNDDELETLAWKENDAKGLNNVFANLSPNVELKRKKRSPARKSTTTSSSDFTSAEEVEKESRSDRRKRLGLAEADQPTIRPKRSLPSLLEFSPKRKSMKFSSDDIPSTPPLSSSQEGKPSELLRLMGKSPSPLRKRRSSRNVAASSSAILADEGQGKIEPLDEAVPQQSQEEECAQPSKPVLPCSSSTISASMSRLKSPRKSARHTDKEIKDKQPGPSDDITSERPRQIPTKLSLRSVSQPTSKLISPASRQAISKPDSKVVDRADSVTTSPLLSSSPHSPRKRPQKSAIEARPSSQKKDVIEAIRTSPFRNISEDKTAAATSGRDSVSPLKQAAVLPSVPQKRALSSTKDEKQPSVTEMRGKVVEQQPKFSSSPQKRTVSTASKTSKKEVAPTASTSKEVTKERDSKPLSRSTSSSPHKKIASVSTASKKADSRLASTSKEEAPKLGKDTIVSRSASSSPKKMVPSNVSEKAHHSGSVPESTSASPKKRVVSNTSKKEIAPAPSASKDAVNKPREDAIATRSASVSPRKRIASATSTKLVSSRAPTSKDVIASKSRDGLASTVTLSAEVQQKSRTAAKSVSPAVRPLVTAEPEAPTEAASVAVGASINRNRSTVTSSNTPPVETISTPIAVAPSTEIDEPTPKLVESMLEEKQSTPRRQTRATAQKTPSPSKTKSSAFKETRANKVSDQVRHDAKKAATRSKTALAKASTVEKKPAAKVSSSSSSLSTRRMPSTLQDIPEGFRMTSTGSLVPCVPTLDEGEPIPFAPSLSHQAKLQKAIEEEERIRKERSQVKAHQVPDYLKKRRQELEAEREAELQREIDSIRQSEGQRHSKRQISESLMGNKPRTRTTSTTTSGKPFVSSLELRNQERQAWESKRKAREDLLENERSKARDERLKREEEELRLERERRVIKAHCVPEHIYGKRRDCS
ncbi:unnamed protein product [Sympodiomycopsis kandeliae]